MFICFKKDGVTCGTKSFFSHMIVYDHDIRKKVSWCYMEVNYYF